MWRVRNTVHNLLALVAVLLIAVSTSQAQGLRGSTQAPKRAPTPVDGIAAIVDREAITVREVEGQAARLAVELQSQRLPVPSRERLERQALDMLITERVIQQQSAELGVKVTEKDIDQAIEEVAKSNNVGVPVIKDQLKRIGVSWENYRRQIERDLILDRTRETIARQTVRVSESEVDAYLKERAARKSSGLEPPRVEQPAPPPPPKPRPQAAQPLILQLSQIFLRIPEGASDSTIAEIRKRIDDIRGRLRAGESFEDLAIRMSEAPESVRGGDLGVRPANGWPDIFVRHARPLGPGQISGVFQSPAGFHILKVVNRAGGQQAAPPPPPPAPEPVKNPYEMPEGPMQVEQTKARHILIRTTAITNDEIARERLEAARDRIVNGGEPFEKVAKKVSEDSSGPQGGDLGWVSPGETVPPFEEAMNALKPGEVSEPVQSPFGWHLIQVLERRTEDVAEQTRRGIARQILFERRAAAQFDAWLQHSRLVTFIDNRMFKQR